GHIDSRANDTPTHATYTVSLHDALPIYTQVAVTGVSSGSTIDTQNPTVTAVALSDTKVTDADAGNALTATITFSEAMDQSSSPGITNRAATPQTLPTNGHWLLLTHYAIT